MNRNPLDSMLGLLHERLPKGAAEDLLQRRQLPFTSSSWPELIDKRLRPAVAGGELAPEDLIELWRSGEQHLSFHAFLYRCPAARARELIDPATVKRRAGELQLTALLELPRALYGSGSPKPVDIRREPAERLAALSEGSPPPGERLVIQVEETRSYERYGTPKRRNGQLVREVSREAIPAANFLELYDDGLLVLRVESHPYWHTGQLVDGRRRGANDYSGELRRLRRAVAGFLGDAEFQPHWLIGAKSSLWTQRRRLAGEPRFSRLRLRDNYQALLELKTGSGDDLADNPGASRAADDFFAAGGSSEEVNLWWHGLPVTLPHKERNEFSFGKGWTRERYAGILDGLLANNP